MSVVVLNITLHVHALVLRHHPLRLECMTGRLFHLFRPVKLVSGQHAFQKNSLRIVLILEFRIHSFASADTSSKS